MRPAAASSSPDANRSKSVAAELILLEFTRRFVDFTAASFASALVILWIALIDVMLSLRPAANVSFPI